MKIFVLVTILFIIGTACPYTGNSQNSFDLQIDVLGLCEYPIDVKQINNGNYVSIIVRQRPNYEWKLQSILYLVNPKGEIIAQDSLISGDTIFNVSRIVPYKEGILAFGHFGFFSDTSWLKPLGQFFSYYDLENDTFNLRRLTRYYIKDSIGSAYSWSTWPVIVPGTDTCFIGCYSEISYNNMTNIVLALNVTTGDSLFISDLPVPPDCKSCDLLYTNDNRLNFLFEHWLNNDYTVTLFKMDAHYSAFSDTLYAHFFLESYASKAEVLPNGNIILAGSCDSAMFDPFDILHAYGVFLYDSDFNYITHKMLTNFNSDTASHTAWQETAKVNSSGEIFVLSNYDYEAFPFEGKATKGYIAKLSSDLDLIWEEYFGNDRYYSLYVIEPTHDGGAIFCAEMDDLGDTISRTYSLLRKYDENGYVGIKETPLTESKIEIYPNPVHDQLYIESKNKITQVSIFDLNGRIIYLNYPHSSNITLNINEYRPGVYIIQVVENDKEINKKFVIR